MRIHNILLCIVYITIVQAEIVEEYVKYISDYITFTKNYAVPKDNSDITKITDTTVNNFGSFDFIIVGGGTAGSVLTNRLSSVSKWKILLLEIGEPEDRFTPIPALNYYLRSSPRNWGYFTKPQRNSCLGMENRSCVFPRGKALGGSSVIGDMVYGRGNKEDYNRWARAGNKGWSYEDVLPYFKKSEDIQIPDYDRDYHGHNGEVKINYTSPNPLNYDVLVNSNVALGVDKHDTNGRRQIGVSRVQWTINFNKRVSGGSGFVLPAMKTRTNLNVSLNSFVTRILFNGTRAVGVEFIKDGKKYTSLAEKEVILSAGAINSPQLLMLSGVGPKEHLSELGIEVVNDLPVGKFFKDHPVFIPLYVRTVNTAENLTLYDQVARYLKDEAPLTSISSGGPIAYVNTRNSSSEDPNIEIAFLNPPQSVPENSSLFYNLDVKHQEMFSNLNTLTDHLIYVVLLKPRSVGTVTLKSKSPVDYPIIDPAYYTDKKGEDIEELYEGIQYALNLTRTAPFRNINATVVGVAPKCAGLQDHDYWICAIKYLSSTFYHPSCTTRMGISPKDSVVDASLKVHNMQGLRVVDAGSMHDLISGHPLGVIIMMAEKAADMIKLEHNVKLV